MPTTQTIAQTLHGYAQGHRLLASGGEIDARELAELDRLSDLSGYLAADAGFDAYHTAFPCGRYHAYACTWLDAAAPRRGTVLTHTLLIPGESWRTAADALAWTVLHRRPLNGRDVTAYTTELTAPVAATLPPPQPDPNQLAALLNLLLGQIERPVLWVSAESAFDLLRALWRWLWPEARATWSFCTYALQPRRVGRRIFDFLGVPPAALGAFHEFASAAGWWREGGPRLQEAPWLADLLARGPAEVPALLARSRDAGLPAPAFAGLFRAMQRFWELAPGARERLSAARARLDLLERVWPGLSADHPAVVAAIDNVVTLQPTAPLDPRPFWDLRWLLSHVLAEPHLHGESGLGSRILDCVREQVPARLLRARDLALDDFRELYEAAGPQARAAIRDGVTLALKSSEADSVALGPTLVHIAEALSDYDLRRATLRAMATSALVDWFTRRMRDADEGGRAELGQQLAELALGREDPELAAGPWEAVGEPRTALAAAAPIVELHPERLTDFESLLRRIPPEASLAWCMETTADSLAPLAIGVASEILAARDPTVEELVAACDGRAIGAAVFARVCRATNESAIERALAVAPQLACELVATVLQDGVHINPAMARAAIQVAPSASLWSGRMLAALHAAPRVGIGGWLDILWWRLLWSVVQGELAGAEAGLWLADIRADRWIERVTTTDLAEVMRAVDEALARLVQTADAVYGATRSRTVSDLIARAVTVASPLALAVAIDDLCTLVRTIPAGSEHGRRLRGEMLGAVRSRTPDRGWLLVESVFYDVYTAVMNGKNFEASWWSLFSWDRGKHWRHWLVDIWIERGWPPDSFLHCLGDAELARKAFERADDSGRHGREWLRSLLPSLEEQPALLRIWRDVVRG
jgi:hypothetical protein